MTKFETLVLRLLCLIARELVTMLNIKIGIPLENSTMIGISSELFKIRNEISKP
jgi:hypothetical protein